MWEVYHFLCFVCICYPPCRRNQQQEYKSYFTSPPPQIPLYQQAPVLSSLHPAPLHIIQPTVWHSAFNPPTPPDLLLCFPVVYLIFFSSSWSPSSHLFLPLYMLGDYIDTAILTCVGFNYNASAIKYAVEVIIPAWPSPFLSLSFSAATTAACHHHTTSA